MKLSTPLGQLGESLNFNKFNQLDRNGSGAGNIF